MERDDQVELIRKYYRGQLSKSEQETFHQLHEDPDFQEELIQFTLLHDLLEVQSLQQEAASLLSGLEISPFPASLETPLPEMSEEESKEENGFHKFQQAKENGKEQGLDRKGNLTASPTLTSVNDNPERVNGMMTVLGDEKESYDIVRQDEFKEKRRNTWNWLAAAVTISVVCLLGLWWYGKDRNEEVKVSVQQKKSDSTKVADSPKIVNNQLDKPIDTLKSKTDSSNVHPSSSRNLAIKKRAITKAEQQRLAKSNFVADSLPSEGSEDLEVPDALYKNEQHQEAIVAYKKTLEIIESYDPELASRGSEDRELTAFLAYYYLGQSYFSLNQTISAITAFKSASNQAPNSYWKSRTEWYLALAYLKAGQIQQARKLLQKVAAKREAGAYQQKARQLNRKLD